LQHSTKIQIQQFLNYDIFFSINYSSVISRLLAHNAWHSVQHSLACGGPCSAEHAEHA